MKLTNLFIAAIFILSTGCSYEAFNMTKHSYERPEEVTNALSSTIMVLEAAGFEIKNASVETVETEVLRTHKGKLTHQIEYQVWLEVHPYAEHFSIYCTQRRLYDTYGKEGAWKFDKCTSPWMLAKIKELSFYLKRKLELSI